MQDNAKMATSTKCFNEFKWKCRSISYTLISSTHSENADIGEAPLSFDY